MLLLLAGCGGGHKPVKAGIPAPPPAPPRTETPPPPTPSVAAKPEPAPEPEIPAEEQEPVPVPADAKPVMTETGLASWYGPPYHNRRGSNGEVYNMHAFTAAHRTLPLGSIVRVTNEKSGNSVVVRITDRGPFIEGRIIDLSLAAAKKADIWRAGVAPVRLEVLQTPAPLDQGGRWAVQIGAFGEEDAAREVTGSLSRRYHTAKVLCFNSPIGDWWVRVRVKDDDRKRAEEVARETHTTEGSIFLVRLD